MRHFSILPFQISQFYLINVTYSVNVVMKHNSEENHNFAPTVRMKIKRCAKSWVLELPLTSLNPLGQMYK